MEIQREIKMLNDQFLSDTLVPREAHDAIKSQGFHVRELKMDDFHKGFLRVLGMLTCVGSLTFGQFIDRYNFLKSRSDEYHILVIEDLSRNLIGMICIILLSSRLRHFIH